MKYTWGINVEKTPEDLIREKVGSTTFNTCMINSANSFKGRLSKRNGIIRTNNVVKRSSKPVNTKKIFNPILHRQK